MAEYMPGSRVTIRHDSKEHDDRSVLFVEFESFWKQRGWTIRGDRKPEAASPAVPTTAGGIASPPEQS